jgi:hypothetical protein
MSGFTVEIQGRIKTQGRSGRVALFFMLPLPANLGVFIEMAGGDTLEHG